MDEEISMGALTLTEKTRAIVCFGPATPTTGMRPGEYYQITIDPNMCSPSGEYIRFGFYEGDEIVGWQRVAAFTVVENLGVSNAEFAQRLPSGQPKDPAGYAVEPEASVTVSAVS